MKSGVVKWFNNAKGYGFILPDDGEQDVFVHYSSIEMTGYKTLKAGQSVSFEVVPGPKGLHVTRLELPFANQANAAAQTFSSPASKMADNIADENRDMYEV